MEQEYNHPLYMLNYMLNKATRGGVSKADAAASGRAARRRRPLNLAAPPTLFPRPRRCSERTPRVSECVSWLGGTTSANTEDQFGIADLSPQERERQGGIL